jgi:23S rRNA (guanosine2251-2'-O)-methyltransferase
VNGDTVKRQQAVFNIPICKVEHIKDAIFLAASGIKTIAATERQIPLSMIFP